MGTFWGYFLDFFGLPVSATSPDGRPSNPAAWRKPETQPKPARRAVRRITHTVDARTASRHADSRRTRSQSTSTPRPARVGQWA